MNESEDRTASGAEPQRISVSQHEKNLRELRCVVSDMYPVTLHHCHGGSMTELGPHLPNPGMGEKANPFFQIPLLLKFHTGDQGIDGAIGLAEWEAFFGTQVEFLWEVNSNLDYNIWEQAVLWSNENLKSATPVTSHLS